MVTMAEGFFQSPKVFKSANAPETFFGHFESGGRPAQHHLAVVPALDSMHKGAGTSETAFDHVGAGQTVGEATIDAKLLKSERFLQSLLEAACRHRADVF